MKLSAFIDAAAVIGASFITANPSQAAGCYPSIAARIIDQVIKGGGSPQMAIQSAVDNGDINNQGCTIRVRGHMRNYESIYKQTLQTMGR